MDTVAEVRAFVVSIPRGSVVSYGEIGRFLGLGPRQVGRAVSQLEDEVPWWRVVRADGTPALCRGGTARALLEAESVPFRGQNVDMTKIPNAPNA